MILLIPGALLTDLLLPDGKKSLGIALVLGIGLVLLEIQVLFIVCLVASVAIPLFFWVAAFNGVLVTVLCWLSWRREHSHTLNHLFRIDRWLMAIMFLAVVMRVCLAWLAQGSIAPDASLYSDYAREIMNGSFQSSVLNDGAVTHLTSTVDYVAHHAFTYVAAISWLLLSPLTSGPTLILIVEGVALVEIMYSITAVHFSRTTARMVAVLVAMQPLFLFHSAVGYGPEITALLFLLAGYYLLPDHTSRTRLGLITSGVLVGLVDVIWYTDFYAACLCLPLLLRFTRGESNYDTIVFSFMMGFAFIGRLFFTSALVFYLSFAGVVLTCEAARFLKPSINLEQFLPFFAAIFMVIAFWRWPLQVRALTSGVPVIPAPANPIGSALLSPPSLSLLAQFLQFFLFHLTPTLFVLVVLALLFGKNRTVVFVFALVAALVSVGTIKVFSLLPGSLEYQYLFADSRFFLLIIAALIICIGGFLERYLSSEEPSKAKENARLHVHSWKPVLLIAIVAVGFMVEYPFMQTGLDLINVRERYAWTDIEVESGMLGNESTVFLVDRAREFSWVTGRDSAILSFTQVGLSFSNASKELVALAHEFNASYVVVDPYTVGHWATFSELLQFEIPIGSSVPLCTNITSMLESQNGTGPTLSLKLVAETPPNSLGQSARIFGFENLSYTRVWDADLLSPGWSASNGGAIVNSTGYHEVVIGNLQNYTNTWRPALFDLNLSVEAGFLLCRILNTSARVARIEVWNSAGSFVCYAQGAETGLYCCPLNNVTIGDIRVVIEGSPGDSVIIHSMSLWNVERV